MTHVYDNGVTREQQVSYNRTYRQKQRQLRDWVDRFAEIVGVDRDDVIRVDPLDLADAYKKFMTIAPVH